MGGRLRGVRVIVAGAGLAGLTAARALAREGAAVRVFEARDRLGGRVWTWRDGSVAPFHAELGGELIEQDHKALRALCRELDLTLARVLRSGFALALQLDGRIRRHRTQTPLWKQFGAAFSPYIEALQNTSDAWTSSAAAAVARVSVSDALTRYGASPAVREMAVALRNLYLGDPDRLSALVAANEIMAGGNPSALTAYRVRGGNDRIVDALARTPAVRIWRRTAVRAVAQTSRSVRVTVETASNRRAQADADALVVALPPPLVRDIRFTPALPEPQRQALADLPFGPATRVVLRYERPWWRRLGRPRAFGTNLPIGAVWDAAEEQRGAALLTLLAGGRASGTLRRLARGQAAALNGQLRWLGAAPAAIGRQVVSWEDDPWARGAYAFFSPEFDPALQPWLGRASGRVFFAGSHTSQEFAGYMNGAVESGERVAREIGALIRL